MHSPRLRLDRGFTLVEMMVATALVATAVAALAHLVAVGVRQGTATRRALEAAVHAQSKLEELRAVPWTFSTDALAMSPPTALAEDTPGFFDTAAGASRRWAVVPLSPLAPDVRVISVCVDVSVPDRPEACVTTTRTKRP